MTDISAELSVISEGSRKKLSREGRIGTQAPKMPPHTKTHKMSAEALPPHQQPSQQHQQQQSHQAVGHGQAATPPIVAVPQNQQSPQVQSSQQQSQPHPQQPSSNPAHPNHPNNIPSQNIQPHGYHQIQNPHQQPVAMPPNFMQHGGPVTSAAGYHMIPPVPNLYFSNFTANVNVHGYSHSMQPPYMQANSQSYVPGDGQSNAVEQQPMQMPSQPPPFHPRGRRGRGRGNGNSYRRDYPMRQVNSVQDMSSQQVPSHLLDSQPMLSSSSNYAPSYYMNPYMGVYANQFAFGHPHSSAPHATGSPLYVAGAMPGYGYAYHPGVIYPMIPMDYVVNEKNEEAANSENGNPMMSGQWQVEYVSPPQIEPAMQQQAEEYTPAHHQPPPQIANEEFNPQPQLHAVEEFTNPQANFIQRVHENPPQEEFFSPQHHAEAPGAPEFMGRVPEFIYQQPEQPPPPAHFVGSPMPVYSKEEDSFQPEFIPNGPQNAIQMHPLESIATAADISQLQNIESNIEFLEKSVENMSLDKGNRAATPKEHIELKDGNQQQLNHDISEAKVEMQRTVNNNLGHKGDNNAVKTRKSVAVSVVPSNECLRSEPLANRKHQIRQTNSDVTCKAVDTDNNNGNGNEAATNLIAMPIINKPIVPNNQEQSSSVSSTTSSSNAMPQNESKAEQPAVPAAPAASPLSSWASLFSTSSPAGGSRVANVDASKKPVAKVSPYNTANESSTKTNNVPAIVSPTPLANSAGALSYSAASSQDLHGNTLSLGASKKQPPVKARIAPSAKAPSQFDAHRLDEASSKLGGGLKLHGLKDPRLD